MESNKEKNPPQLADEDEDVVGYANAPISREDDSKTPTTPPPVTPEHENDPTCVPGDPQTASVTPGSLMQLTGWRDFVHGIVLLSAITLPWISSMILSWLPLTRISLREAPKEILVSMVASTLEVAAIFLGFCFPSNSPPGSKPDRRTNIQLSFILACPIATGVYVWIASGDLSCKHNPDSPACRVGANFIRAIGCFRVFGVLGIFACGLWITWLVTKRMEELEKRKNLLIGENV